MRKSPYENKIALCQESPKMVLSPTLEYVVAWSPTFRAVCIQQVVVGEMTSRPIIPPGLGGSIDPLHVKEGEACSARHL